MQINDAGCSPACSPASQPRSGLSRSRSFPACAVAAGLELWRHGWRGDRTAWRALIAPAMATARIARVRRLPVDPTWAPRSHPTRSSTTAWQESKQPAGAALPTARAPPHRIQDLPRRPAPLRRRQHQPDRRPDRRRRSWLGRAVPAGAQPATYNYPSNRLDARGGGADVHVSRMTPPNARDALLRVPGGHRVRPTAAGAAGSTALLICSTTLLLACRLSWFTFVGVDFRP